MESKQSYSQSGNRIRISKQKTSWNEGASPAMNGIVLIILLFVAVAQVNLSHAQSELHKEERQIPSGFEERFTFIQIANLIKEKNSGARFQHAKSHFATKKAKFFLDKDIPAKFKVGLFKQKKEWNNVVVRLSSANGEHWPDSKGDLRGLAFRIGKNKKARDFLATNANPHHLKDARRQLAFLKRVGKLRTLIRDFDELDEIVKPILLAISENKGKEGDALLDFATEKTRELARPILDYYLDLVGFYFRDSISGQNKAEDSHRLAAREFVQTVLQLRNQIKESASHNSLATQTYYSRSPFLMGDTIVRYKLEPTATKNNKVDRSDDNFLSKEFRQRLDGGETIVFLLRVQEFSMDKPETTPVEDQSAFWPTPYTTIGRLEIPAKAASTKLNKIAFNPWTNVGERTDKGNFFYPLGQLNRARKHAYEASVKARTKK